MFGWLLDKFTKQTEHTTFKKYLQLYEVDINLPVAFLDECIEDSRNIAQWFGGAKGFSKAFDDSLRGKAVNISFILKPDPSCHHNKYPDTVMMECMKKHGIIP